MATLTLSNDKQSHPIRLLKRGCACALLFWRGLFFLFLSFFAFIILFENIYLFFSVFEKSIIKVTYKPEREGRKQSESAENVIFIKSNYRNNRKKRLTNVCQMGLLRQKVIGRCLVHRPLEDQSDVSLLTVELLGAERTCGMEGVRSVRKRDLTPKRSCFFWAHVAARAESMSGRGCI